MTLKHFVAQSRDFFSRLDVKLVDQRRPTFFPGKPCCIGAHLARFYRLTAYDRLSREALDRRVRLYNLLAPEPILFFRLRERDKPCFVPVPH